MFNKKFAQFLRSACAVEFNSSEMREMFSEQFWENYKRPTELNVFLLGTDWLTISNMFKLSTTFLKIVNFFTLLLLCKILSPSILPTTL